MIGVGFTYIIRILSYGNNYKEYIRVGERLDPDPPDSEPKGNWPFTREPVSRKKKNSAGGDDQGNIFQPYLYLHEWPLQKT